VPTAHPTPPHTLSLSLSLSLSAFALRTARISTKVKADFVVVLACLNCDLRKYSLSGTVITCRKRRREKVMDVDVIVPRNGFD
jgi:hypothetical protein